MAMTRRTFVTTSALAVLGAITGRAIGSADAAAAAAAPGLRPAASGSSSTRCARCGSPAHTALDGSCGEGAQSKRSVQASARHLATRPAAGRGAVTGSDAWGAGA
jgi:hypothetical protein